MKIMVTGGAGFIGSHFIKYMMQKYPHYSIVNYDLLTYAGNLANVGDIQHAANYRFVQGDVADREQVHSIFSEGVDILVNFAAESHVDRSTADPSAFVRTNMMGTHVLLDAARIWGIQKYIQISTDEVYGSLGETGYFHELTPLAPNNPYSASKAGADLLVRAYHETFGLPMNISRSSNNYGPYQFPEKLIPLTILRAIQGKSLPVYGDGLNVRDWLHVEDHCSAVDLVLHNGTNGEVYNIGGNQESTNIEIVHTIVDLLKANKNLIQFVKDRPGHDRRYAIDASKIRNELGWQPKYTLDRGLSETIQWYLNSRDWWHGMI